MLTRAGAGEGACEGCGGPLHRYPALASITEDYLNLGMATANCMCCFCGGRWRQQGQTGAGRVQARRVSGSVGTGGYLLGRWQRGGRRAGTHLCSMRAPEQ